MDNWKIAHEGNCWTVCERKVAGADAKTPGEVSWSGRSFHATPQQACLWLLNRLLADELGDAPLADNLSATLDALERAQERIKDVCRTWAQSGAKAA